MERKGCEVRALQIAEMAIEVLRVELADMDQLTAEALATQGLETANGFSTGNDALARLVRDLRADELRAMVRRLRNQNIDERQLAARLLKESALSPEAVLDEVRTALSTEAEPTVVRWLVSALGYTRSPSALADLRALASHPVADVRFQVPDALSMCATGAFDQVADPLLQLSGDADDDVRWSAIYELRAWLSDLNA